MIDNGEPDERLIAQWQSGRRRDEISEILVERYALRVGRFFQKRGFFDDACQDLGQEVFLRVFRGLPRFRHDACFQTWLFEIVRNVWKNAVRCHRTEKRDASREVPLEDVVGAGAMNPGPTESTNGDGPLDRVLVKERLRHLRDAVAKLSPELQRLLICQLYHGLKVSEIAAVLKIPEGTVKSRLSTARRMLRKKLKHLKRGGNSSVPLEEMARRRWT